MYEVNSQRKANKPVWLLLFLMMSVLVAGFYGCQFFQQKTEPVSVDDRVPMDRRIGILKSLGGVKTSNQGTHILQLDDGNTILLKSLQINLDDAQYLGKSVEVRGLLTYTTDNKQIMEVMNIDLVQQETSVAPEAISWKDYSSSGLGLQIKYRDDLLMDDKSDGKVIFSRAIESTTQQTTETQEPNEVTHRMSISREALAAGETMSTKLGVGEEGQSELLASGLSKSKIGSGNYDALKKTEGNETIYYIEADSYLYTIKIDCGSDEKTLTDQNLFYEMLGTMKLPGAAMATLTQEAAQTDEETVTTTTPAPVVGSQEPAAEAEEKTPAPSPNAAPTMQSLPPDITEASETQESQQVNEGFTTMESTSFKFSVQYPKSWYYSGSASSETDVIRHYEFGTKPLEEAPGSVSLDLMTGSIPSGSTSSVNGNTVTTVSSGGIVELYVKGSGSRIYKIAGPSGQKDTLLEIAGSLKD
jgi:hypothetical protein